MMTNAYVSMSGGNNSCGYSVGLGLMIDDGLWWWQLLGSCQKMIDSWQVWRDWWEQVAMAAVAWLTAHQFLYLDTTLVNPSADGHPSK